MVDDAGRTEREDRSMIFNRLAIGTANWQKEYNGAKVSEDDQKRILDYCQCSGIDMIDTATAYEWDWTKVSSYFNVVVKVRHEDDINYVKSTNPYCIMAHSYEYYMKEYLLDYSLASGCRGKHGVSLYEAQNLDTYMTCLDIAQVPYSIYDRRFEFMTANLKKERTSPIEIHVRSIFLRGKILEKFQSWQCIAFCLMNPHVDRVIIGADSYKQFKENLQPFHDMNAAEKHDINLLDPRLWENK